MQLFGNVKWAQAEKACLGGKPEVQGEAGRTEGWACSRREGSAWPAEVAPLGKLLEEDGEVSPSPEHLCPLVANRRVEAEDVTPAQAFISYCVVQPCPSSAEEAPRGIRAGNRHRQKGKEAKRTNSIVWKWGSIVALCPNNTPLPEPMRQEKIHTGEAWRPLLHSPRSRQKHNTELMALQVCFDFLSRLELPNIWLASFNGFPAKSFSNSFH